MKIIITTSGVFNADGYSHIQAANLLRQIHGDDFVLGISKNSKLDKVPKHICQLILPGHFYNHELNKILPARMQLIDEKFLKKLVHDWEWLYLFDMPHFVNKSLDQGELRAYSKNLLCFNDMRRNYKKYARESAIKEVIE